MSLWSTRGCRPWETPRSIHWGVRCFVRQHSISFPPFRLYQALVSPAPASAAPRAATTAAVTPTSATTAALSVTALVPAAVVAAAASSAEVRLIVVLVLLLLLLLLLLNGVDNLVGDAEVFDLRPAR